MRRRCAARSTSIPARSITCRRTLPTRAISSSYVLQFQFHRALTKIAGCTTPLHRCSIYGSAEAGTRLKNVLAMGVSKPWPEALEAMTGERQLDANAIADYFAPLKAWLDEQNKGSKVGW